MRPNDLIDALMLAGPALTGGLGVGAAGYWLLVAWLERGWRGSGRVRGASTREWR